MKKGIVVQGDPTTGGGEVLVGSGYMIDGEIIAVLGDPVSCKNPFHVAGNIVEGDENLLVNGKPVALHGHKVSCGCTLISTKLPELNFVDKPITTLEKTMCLAAYSEKFANEARKESLKKIFNIQISENIKNIIEFFLSLPEKCAPNEICTKLPLDKLLLQNPKRCDVIVNSELDKKKKESNINPTKSKKTKLDCSNNEYRGGPHKETRLPIGDGKDSHHIPAKEAYKGSKMYPPGEKIKAENGPAIQMDPEDHRALESTTSQAYRDKQRVLLQQGKLKEAIQMDIEDINSVAAKIGKPDKYKCALQEALNYADTLDPDDFRTPAGSTPANANKAPIPKKKK